MNKANTTSSDSKKQSLMNQKQTELYKQTNNSINNNKPNTPNNNNTKMNLTKNKKLEQNMISNLFSSKDYISKLLESNDTNSSSPPSLAISALSLAPAAPGADKEQSLIFSSYCGSGRGERQNQFISSDSMLMLDLLQKHTEKEFSSKDWMAQYRPTKHDDEVEVFPPVFSTNNFSSKDWMGYYITNHEDVNYTSGNLFRSSDCGAELLTSAGADEQKDAGRLQSRQTSSFSGGDSSSNSAIPKTDWMNEFNRAICGSSPQAEKPLRVESLLAGGAQDEEPMLVEAPMIDAGNIHFDACNDVKSALSNVPSVVNTVQDQHTPQSIVVPPTSGGAVAVRDVKPKFVIPTEIDILLGRGGRSNNHPGNKRYLEEVNALKHCYRSSSKNERTDWSQCLVDYVHAYGGRFLRFDREASQWYEVPNRIARKKASQALREENTPESRAKKRQRYKKPKTQSKGAMKNKEKKS